MKFTPFQTTICRASLILVASRSLFFTPAASQDGIRPPSPGMLNPETIERQLNAVLLEQKEDYAGALKILQSLADHDYFIPMRDEMCYTIPSHIPATRQLAMMRCLRAIGQTSEAVEIAWIVLERQWTDDEQVKEIIAEETAIQGGVEAVGSRLKDLLVKNPRYFMAKDTLDYLEVLIAAEQKDYKFIVALLASSGVLLSDGNRSQRWLKEISSRLLVLHAADSVPVLIEATKRGRDMGVWVIYTLGRSADDRAITPLFHRLLQARNARIRDETAMALARLGESAVRHCLTKLKSSNPLERERAAQVLSKCEGGVLESADSNLQRILSALQNPQNHGNKPHVVNIPIFLLRAIASTGNGDYITPLKESLESVATISAISDYGVARSLALLGDMSVVPQLLKSMEGKYASGALQAMRTLAKRPNAGQDELREWGMRQIEQQSWKDN